MKNPPLYDRHLALSAKIIDFGGWAMPVQYTSVVEEHQTTRGKVGLFDICHMGEIEVRGHEALDFLQWVMSRNLSEQAIGQIKLSVMTNENGGIIDDLTVYRLGDDHYMVVTNAGTKDKDLAWMLAKKGEKGFTNVRITDITDHTGKLDLQGPLSQQILQRLIPDDLTQLKYYHSMNTTILHIPVLVSRSGYTGEDGFEIYAHSECIGAIWDALLDIGSDDGMKPIGLGARDTLRLEAGMTLYGHEIDETITPLEAGYGWVTSLEKNFIGSDALRKLKQGGLTRKLIGFEMEDRGIARQGYKIMKDEQEVGYVTSGTFTPTLQKAIGLAFVPVTLSESGTEIWIQIRDHSAKARIVPLPFLKRKR